MVVTSSYTVSESSTQTDILNRFLRESRLGTYGTATGGTTSTLVDSTKLKSVQFNNKQHVGGWLRIAKDAGGAAAAPEGEIGPITAYEPGQGELTVSPALTTAPASGDTYQVWHSIHPQDVIDSLNEVLSENIFIPSWTILTEVPDGDMEQAAATGYWTGTNATVTKDSTEPAMRGKRWLKVVTTGAGGYAASQTLYVEPGERYHLSADVRASAANTTVQLVAYDATNSAALKTVTTASQAIVRLWMEFTAPADCYQVVVRVGAAESGVTVFADEVAFYPVNAREIRLPWWVRNRSQIKATYRLRGDMAVGSNAWESTLAGPLDKRWDAHEDRGRMKFVTRMGGGIPMPIFILGTRNEMPFADANSDTTSGDADLINAALCFKVFDHLAAHPESGVQNRDWITERRLVWENRYEIELRRQGLRIEQAMQAEQLDQYFSRETHYNFGGTDVLRGAY